MADIVYTDLYSKKPETREGAIGRLKTPIKMIIEHESDVLTKKGGIRTKGADYLGAYLRASLHKIDTKGKNVCASPNIKEGRVKWDTCYHFENVFSAFNAGDWEIWLELFFAGLYLTI